MINNSLLLKQNYNLHSHPQYTPNVVIEHFCTLNANINTIIITII